MGDYPDYTELMQILGSDIMVPIDIQGAYIMMPVDIQAQYITLEIDIVAQSVGSIAIDIAAQTIGNIEVDIVAQAVGNLTIRIDAQSVGIYLQGDWSALQGSDKNFQASSGPAGWGDVAYIDYAVPSGKTLFITGASFTIFASDPAEYDHLFYGFARISNVEDNIHLVELGGIGGNSLALTKPVTIPGGKTFRALVACYSNLEANIRITAWGFEV